MQKKDSDKKNEGAKRNVQEFFEKKILNEWVRDALKRLASK